MNRAAQLRSAQIAYDNECDCCDHAKREPAPYIERAPYPDAEREWAGVDEPRMAKGYKFLSTYADGAELPF